MSAFPVTCATPMITRMQASVTVKMNAPADDIWKLVADVRNTGRFSPETFEAEWLDGARAAEA